MDYILRDTSEPARLAAQSNLAAYSLEEELAGIELPEGSRILDAGCGSGALLRHLQHRADLKLSGCDLLEEHVAFCRDRFPEGVRIFQHDLLEGPPVGPFDHIFLRYVAHHLGSGRTGRALRHLGDALAPGGRLTCIDADGILVQLGSTDARLLDYLDRIRSNFSGDVLIGGKLAQLMTAAGLSIESSHIRTIHFEGPSRREEREQFRQRFANGKAAYVRMLGGERAYHDFVALYLSEFARPEIPYAMTKHSVTGRKHR